MRPVPPALAGTEPVAEAKKALAGFDSFVADAIKAWEVPGLAVATVKDGEVVFAQGFGLRDVANSLPVTPKTLFAIGSCTKAFTTFVMGTLVDEGKLDWDSPVRVYIPEFRLFDRTATELMTPRDLVTHRSGLPRHDLVWYNSTLSRKEVLERLPYLEPSESFRSKFQYNNLMYITAGYLIERITGKPWEEAIRAHIWKPLGMTGCNFSVKESQHSADFAKPYQDRDDKIVEVPFRDITSAAGPAGSINAGIADMARWLIVQTHKGKVNGRQIISAAVLADIQTPHMTTGVLQERKEIAPAGYALGWMVDDYRGHRRVHHGGGIDGFTAQTVVFADDGLGICILSNMGGTAFPSWSHATLPIVSWGSRRSTGAARNWSRRKRARRPRRPPRPRRRRFAGLERRRHTSSTNMPANTNTRVTGSFISTFTKAAFT